MRFKPLLYRIASPIRKIYWRILKPETHGVRVLIIHPDNPNRVLLIKHTYGNRNAWNIPGGGYKPKKEKPDAAAVREVVEEIGITPINVKNIGVYESGGEGKRDIVTIFSATVKNPDEIKLGPEIAESTWSDYQVVNTSSNFSSVTKESIRITYNSDL